MQLAFEVFNAERMAEAEALCRVLLQVEPKEPQAPFLLGMVLHRTRRDKEAVKWLQAAVEADPGAARCYHGLGLVYYTLKQYRPAIECFTKCLALKPDQADVHHGLGNARYAVREVEAALELFQKAVALNPRDQASWNNLGKCLLECNRLAESQAAYQRAIEIDPSYAKARYGRAIALLGEGRLAEGFREYEVRLSIRPPRRHLKKKVWKGEPLEGKTLFLHAEQGYGDAIQAARYLPMTRQRAGRVILECRPELKRLFAYSACADEVLAYGDQMPEFEHYASMISLAGILGITLETVPRQTPYLKAPPGPLLPEALPGTLKVGLVWAGNPGHHDDVSRSMRLDILEPLLQAPGVTFYSLQLRVSLADKAKMKRPANLRDLQGQVTDFLDTAGLLNQMDLLISVDTAVAHLAGALGRRVWTLIQYAPDWRWFLEKPDTIWYPTMRLFRQAERGKWEPVVQRVAAELRELVKGELPSR